MLLFLSCNKLKFESNSMDISKYHLNQDHINEINSLEKNEETLKKFIQKFLEDIKVKENERKFLCLKNENLKNLDAIGTFINSSSTGPFKDSLLLMFIEAIIGEKTFDLNERQESMTVQESIKNHFGEEYIGYICNVDDNEKIKFKNNLINFYKSQEMFYENIVIPCIDRELINVLKLLAILKVDFSSTIKINQIKTNLINYCISEQNNAFKVLIDNKAEFSLESDNYYKLPSPLAFAALLGNKIMRIEEVNKIVDLSKEITNSIVNIGLKVATHTLINGAVDIKKFIPTIRKHEFKHTECYKNINEVFKKGHWIFLLKNKEYLGDREGKRIAKLFKSLYKNITGESILKRKVSELNSEIRDTNRNIKLSDKIRSTKNLLENDKRKRVQGIKERFNEINSKYEKFKLKLYELDYSLDFKRYLSILRKNEESKISSALVFIGLKKPKQKFDIVKKDNFKIWLEEVEKIVLEKDEMMKDLENLIEDFNKIQNE